MSRLSHSARSWYTVSMPSAAASRGRADVDRMALPEDLAAVGVWIPAMHLMSTDLPAPLSPASAVTCPAGTSRSTSVRACTGAEVLVDAAQLGAGPALTGCRLAGVRRLRGVDVRAHDALLPPMQCDCA